MITSVKATDSTMLLERQFYFILGCACENLGAHYHGCLLCVDRV